MHAADKIAALILGTPYVSLDYYSQVAVTMPQPFSAGGSLSGNRRYVAAWPARRRSLQSLLIPRSVDVLLRRPRRRV